MVGTSLAGLAFLAPLWYGAGLLAQRARLPLITGYMLAGVASGPHGLGVLTGDKLGDLALVDHICLGLIALAAGAELQVAELRRLRRQVIWLTVGVSGCSWLAVFVVMQLLAPLLPFSSSQPQYVVNAMATLAGTLAVARSPASAIAVLREMGGKGPYCSLVMAVVVVKDVLVFVAFAINLELAMAAVGQAGAGGGGGMGALSFVQPLLSLATSVLLGGGAGVALGAAMRPGWRSAVLPAPLQAGAQTAVPLLAAGATFLVAELVAAEPLLACVTAGLVVANRRFEVSPGREVTEALAADVSTLMPGVNVVFFGLVGASLKLSALWGTLWAAAVLYGVRLAGVWAGCAAGGAAGGVPPDLRRRVWQGMVTQAGIALGLGRVVGVRFPGWGPDLAALLAGCVVLNLLSGPPLFKAAVVAVGEARAVSGSGGGLPLLAEELQGQGARLKGSDGHRSLPLIPVISVGLERGEEVVGAGAKWAGPSRRD